MARVSWETGGMTGGSAGVLGQENSSDRVVRLHVIHLLNSLEYTTTQSALKRKSRTLGDNHESMWSQLSQMFPLWCGTCIARRVFGVEVPGSYVETRLSAQFCCEANSQE